MLSRNTIYISIFFLFLFVFSPKNTQAQSRRCPRTCVRSSDCPNNAPFCRGGVCWELGCQNMPGNTDPCCRSNKPARPAPTTVPTGVTKPGNPVVPTTATTPGSTDPGTNITPGAGILTPAVTGAPRGGSAGDCSGPVEGTKDGKVDLADFNLLRKEFSGSATTLFCDNDTNGVVDLLDFNIFRIAFIAQK